MGKKLLAILPKVAAAPNALPSDGPTKLIDLSIAENLLLRPELLAICKDAIANDLEPQVSHAYPAESEFGWVIVDQDLSYPLGFGGDPALLDALASFFNEYFHPSIPVQPNHIITTSGAGNALDALLFSICDSDDSVLVPGPYWEGFGPYFRIHANVNPIVVNTPRFDDTLDFGMVTALKKAYSTSAEPHRIKALVLTNPHNPFGQCYPPEVLRECLRFCQVHDLHFISDEVYALSTFHSRSVLPPFVSALSLIANDPETDVEERHGRTEMPNPTRVHVVWSMSKDFGCSGIRMGCVISQANRPVLIGVGLSAYWQTSALSSVVAVTLLRSAKLPALIRTNSERLAESYDLLAETLTKWKLPFKAANAGLFVFAKLEADAKTWEDEAAMIKKLASTGVILAPGRRFDGGEEEKGWARITFAVPKDLLKEALLRIEACIVSRTESVEAAAI